MTYLRPKLEAEILDAKIYKRVVGIDEVGRGCWAGPVAVGAYIYTPESEVLEGVTDSKMLSLKRREALYSILQNHDHIIELGAPTVIDKYGIGKTIEKLILRIVNKYSDGQTYFLIDGQFSQDFGVHSRKVLKGDLNHYSIAAASVLAKVYRDSLMNDLAKEYMYYGFERHKGYGTKVHRDALEKHGPCEIHRRSYKPIAKFGL